MNAHLLGYSDGPVHVVTVGTTSVLLITGVGAELSTIENVDVEVHLDDGTRWSATVFTLAEVHRLLDRWATTGENHGGEYFACADGIIVRQPGVDSILKAIADLLASGQITSTLKRLDP